MDYTEFKDLNLSLWREWTLKATAVNCCKMCSIVVDDTTAAGFMRHVQGYEVPEPIARLIQSIAEGTTVPSGLDCTLRGKFQKNHLMYKIEPLDHPSGKARYEFLVEYDRMEPHVGIYFGCKCITSEGADHRAMINLYTKEWNELQPHVCTVLNNSFPQKEFRHRFRITNNGQDMTFWPSWIGLYDDEDMEFALTVLRIMRKAYEQYFNGTLQPCRELKPILYRRVPAAFTESAFSDLTDAIGRSFGHSRKERAIELFDRFVINASARGIFLPDDSYDLAWRFVGDSALGLADTNIVFSTLMHTLTLEIASRLGAVDRAPKTPWENIDKVFLDSDGVAFKKGTRTQWQNALADTLDVCARTVRICLES